jgi:hypothetical protein
MVENFEGVGASGVDHLHRLTSVSQTAAAVSRTGRRTRYWRWGSVGRVITLGGMVAGRT